MAESAASSSSMRAARGSINSILKPPRWSDSRARQVTLRILPGWSSGLMRREQPPRTRPRWRPCAAVKISAIAFASPSGLADRKNAFVAPVHGPVYRTKPAPSCERHFPAASSRPTARRLPTAQAIHREDWTPSLNCRSGSVRNLEPRTSRAPKGTLRAFGRARSLWTIAAWKAPSPAIRPAGLPASARLPSQLSPKAAFRLPRSSPRVIS